VTSIGTARVLDLVGDLADARPPLYVALADRVRLLVGDGRLSYASENVVEAFYALQLFKGLTATADYQLLVNPAYNTDRGPVHVFSGRLHASF